MAYVSTCVFQCSNWTNSFQNCELVQFIQLKDSFIWTSAWMTDPSLLITSAPPRPVLRDGPSSTATLTRKQEVSLRRLCLEHTQPTHSYLFSNAPCPFCTQYNIQYTIQHILLDCPLFMQARQTTGIANSLQEMLLHFLRLINFSL